MEEKLTKEEHEHLSKQYERMQDMVLNYATLAMKTISFVSSGALVSIGAGYINFLSIKTNTNIEAFVLIKNSFSQSFLLFSWSLVITIFNFVIIYLARVCFMRGCNIKYNKKIRDNNDLYGEILEYIAFILFVLSGALFFKGIFVLSDAFKNFPT